MSAAEVPSTLLTYRLLILRTLPDDAALLTIDVALVDDKSTVTLLPVIVVGETKLGAAICYPQIIEAVTGDTPPLDAVAQESVPDPFVESTCPLLPSTLGSVQVTLEDTVPGALNAT